MSHASEQRTQTVYPFFRRDDVARAGILHSMIFCWRSRRAISFFVLESQKGQFSVVMMLQYPLARHGSTKSGHALSIQSCKKW